MRLSQSSFLLLALALAATTTACTTATEDAATGTDDVVGGDTGGYPGAGGCLENIGDAKAENAEARCLAIRDSIDDAMYVYMTTRGDAGVTPEEEDGCTAYSASNPAPKGASLCEMRQVAEEAYRECLSGVEIFKADTAKTMFECFESITQFPREHADPTLEYPASWQADTSSMRECVSFPLTISCGSTPEAVSTCKVIADALAQRKVAWSTEENDSCLLLVSGLRSPGRALLEESAKSSGRDWHGIREEIALARLWVLNPGAAGTEGGSADPATE